MQLGLSVTGKVFTSLGIATPPGWDAIPSRVTRPPAFCRRYPFILLGGCLAQEHNTVIPTTAVNYKHVTKSARVLIGK